MLKDTIDLVGGLIIAGVSLALPAGVILAVGRFFERAMGTVDREINIFKMLWENSKHDEQESK